MINFVLRDITHTLRQQKHCIFSQLQDKFFDSPSTELFMIMVVVYVSSDENRGQVAQAVQYQGQTFEGKIAF